MKHLKRFEYDPQKFKYLNPEYTKMIEIFIRDFINKQNVTDKIKKMRLDDFVEDNFDYKEIFDNFITSSTYGSENNLYYAVDMFCHTNNIVGSTVENRNTVFDIIDKCIWITTPCDITNSNNVIVFKIGFYK